MAHSDHLAYLLVAYELLVHFLQLLLEHKVLCVFQDLLAVQSQNGFPHFLVQRKVDPLAAVLIKTLKVPVVDADSLSIDRTVTQVVFDFTGDVLPVHNFIGFLFPFLNVDIFKVADHVLVRVEEGVLVADLLVVGHFEYLIWEEEN